MQFNYAYEQLHTADNMEAVQQSVVLLNTNNTNILDAVGVTLFHINKEL